MENTSNDNLIEWYTKGWKDEKYGSASTVSKVKLENYAYKIGVMDFSLGKPLVDSKTQKEILLRIQATNYQ